MNVLMVASSYPKFTGDSTAPFIASLAHGVAGALGETVDVLLPFHPDLDLEGRRGETEVRLHAYRYAPLARWHLWGYATSLSADRHVKLPVFLVLPLALASCLRSLLSLTRRRRYDIVHAHWVIPNGPVAAWVTRLRGIPLVVSLHGSDVFLAERLRILGLAARRCLQRAAWVTACSDDLKHRAIGLGGPAERIETIPYGVDVEKFRLRAGAREHVLGRIGLPPAARIIFTAGRLVGKKGFGYLIEALPRILEKEPQTRCVIAGDGDLRQELLTLAATLGVSERVILTGALSHDEIPLFYSGADVVVVPSVRDEIGNVDGLPNVLMEAMASGAAVVATRVAGIPQVVGDGENGLLVPEKDPSALAAAILALLGNRALQERLSAEGRKRCEATHSWERTARTFVEGYRRILGRPDPGDLARTG